MTRKRLSITAVVVLAIVVLILARCQQEEVEEVEFPEPVRGDVEPLPEAQQRPQVEIRPEQTLIDGQIVLAGEQAQIEEFLGRLPPELELEPLVTTEFTFLRDNPPPIDEEQDNRQQSLSKRQRAGEPLSNRLQDLSSLQVGLFGFAEEKFTVSEALELVVPLALEPNFQGRIIAEPNYVTGFDITGAPWSVEGSPWSVEGSPWSVEGSPDSDAEPSPDIKIASEEFWQQWALGEASGINLLSGADPLENRQIDQRGQGVEVAVFDTSPFAEDATYTFAEWGPDDRIDPLTLEAFHPLTLPESLTETQSTTDTVGISDHGLFVSGLVYAVAPASNLKLIQVLNNQGQGEAQALIDALNIYMLERLTSNDGSLSKTVVNLSLGGHAPSKDELSEEARQQLVEMLQAWGYQVPNPDEGPLPIAALKLTMDLFHTYNATVVAASGNHSAEEATPLPAQYPAAFSTVISVTASSKVATQSCYANKGGLMAPGGDGGLGDSDGDGVEGPKVDDNECLPTHMTCRFSDPEKTVADEPEKGPECGFGVVSYSQNAHRGFAYWVGTSFATPLVSGMAANLIEAGATSPTQVHDTLLCTGAGNNVVDVVRAVNLVTSGGALTNCPP